MSGLSRSPCDGSDGPRLENAATTGACATFRTDAVIDAVGLAVAAYARIAVPVAASTCTVGTGSKSALSDWPSFGLYMIMPTPPAALTAQPLSVRPLVPRAQTTIFPVTLAGSSTATPGPSGASAEKHNLAAAAGMPGSAAAAASISGLDGNAAP